MPDKRMKNRRPKPKQHFGYREEEDQRVNLALIHKKVTSRTSNRMNDDTGGECFKIKKDIFFGVVSEEEE